MKRKKILLHENVNLHISCNKEAVACVGIICATSVLLTHEVVKGKITRDVQLRSIELGLERVHAENDVKRRA